MATSRRIRNRVAKGIVKTELKHAEKNNDIAAVMILKHYSKKYA